MSYGSGKSEWLAQWEAEKDALWVNERPNGDKVVMSRKSRFEAFQALSDDDVVNCNVLHIEDPEEERRVAFEIQGYEMEQGWA
jgi:predicted phosphoadenosine phosphosulfate sulfurtransferase